VETTAVSNLDDFQALDPFFRIIEEGVAGVKDRERIEVIAPVNDLAVDDR
jgi:hypothetical protein